jgi:hypothetical protein
MMDIILKGEGDQRGGNDPARHHGNRDQGDRETWKRADHPDLPTLTAFWTRCGGGKADDDPD